MPRRSGRSPKMLPVGRPARAGASLVEALATQMSAAIAGGAIEIGAYLPPEREFARRHRVGRITVRGALGRLVAAGLIESRPGAGHRVVRRKALCTDTRPVGLVYKDLAAFRSGTSKSVSALENALAEQDRALLIGSSGLTADGENRCIKRFRAAGAGALVVAPATTGGRSTELEAWIERGQLVVLEGHPGRWLLSAQHAARCDRVDIDNLGGVLQALEYLKGLGHRAVGFLTLGATEGSERYQGFLEGARRLGLPIDPAWMLARVSDLHAVAARLRAETARPTAMFCPDDGTALALVRAARLAGLACPVDLSVVGFGNESLEGSMETSALTTIDYAREDLAKAILRLLDERLNGKHGPGEEVRLPTRLLVRGSCAAPPGGER